MFDWTCPVPSRLTDCQHSQSPAMSGSQGGRGGVSQTLLQLGSSAVTSSRTGAGHPNHPMLRQGKAGLEAALLQAARHQHGAQGKRGFIRRKFLGSNPGSRLRSCNRQTSRMLTLRVRPCFNRKSQSYWRRSFITQKKIPSKLKRLVSWCVSYKWLPILQASQIWHKFDYFSQLFFVRLALGRWNRRINHRVKSLIELKCTELKLFLLFPLTSPQPSV